ncbi:hypothetical protein RTM1035_00955 [Roseovarius sp. TM1035]|jgi:hypothetical protein|nr:hypothetical protein RTM1035_00955 [Roseovarius sp. TM1035]
MKKVMPSELPEKQFAHHVCGAEPPLIAEISTPD